MSAVKDAEFKVILDLTELLNKNADKVKSGETKVCLTTSSLSILGASFRRYSEGTDRQDGGEATSSNWISRLKHKKVVIDHEKWRENVRTLFDFIIKIKSLKVILGSNTLKAPVQIARFKALQVLEVKKVPIHMVEGMSKLRGQLTELIVTRSAQSLQDVLEICGGDRSSGFVWSNLKTLYVSFNGFKQLDNSLRFIPFVEVLDLSHNNICSTEDYLQHLTDIRKINFGYNMLTACPQFSYSNKGKLKTLVLRNNNLDNLEGIEELKLLEELDVTENCLIEHSVLNVLRPLGRLTVLYLMGNPLFYTSNHRLKTVEHISPHATLGAFVLDGNRLSVEEIFIHRKNKYNGTTDSSVTIVADPPSSDDSLVTRSLTRNNTAGSMLSPGTPHSEKKKRGHKRVKSKERIPKIADMSDSLNESYTVSTDSPYGSSKEEENIAAQIEMDKKKIEIMRKHYKDDWLKALSADQGKAAKADTRKEVTDTNGSLDGNGVNDSNGSRDRHHTEGQRVQDESKQSHDSGIAKPNETKDEIDGLDQTDSEATPTPAMPTKPATPTVIKIEQTTDIYAFSRMQSIEVMLDKPKYKLAKDNLEQYGEESDPFIVMLPDQDMNHLIITVNNRYLIEKNLNGERREALDLKFLMDYQRSMEKLSSRDIIGGISFLVVTLKFDYARKDMRERRYVMEDDSFADKLEALLSRHLKKESEDIVECLKCRYQFPKEHLAPSPLPACPKCNSKMLIKVDTPTPEGHQDTSTNRGELLGTSNELMGSKPNASPRLQRRAAFKQSAKHKTETIQETQNRDDIDGQTTTAEELKHNNSWSDVQKLLPSARGSVSSVESDITILGSNKSGACIAESSQDCVVEIEAEHSGGTTEDKQNSSTEHFSIPKQNSSASIDIQTGSLERSFGRVKEHNDQLTTPVGSPLSNSVCSSMVSSVYEKTLPGNGLQQDNGSGENTQNSSFTSSSADSVSIRHSNTVDKETKSRNRSVMYYAEGPDDDTNAGGRTDKSGTSITTVPSVSLTEAYETNNSIYDTCLSDVGQDKTSQSIYVSDTDSIDRSVDLSNVSTEVSQNVSNNCHSSPLKRDSSIRRRKERTEASADIYLTTESLSDFPSDFSPIKRTSSNNRSRRSNNRSALIFDDESLPIEEPVSLETSQVSVETSEKDESKDSLSQPKPLPWDQERGVTDMPHGGVNLDEFRNVDHRIQLYLELKVFQAEEVCQCTIQCEIVQYMKVEPVKSLLVISSHRLLIFETAGLQVGDVSSDWLKCYEDQPIAELRYIDIGLGYQSLRIEFKTTCSSFSLLIADESRCKNFLALLTDIVHNLDHSRLEGISKSNPVTLTNVDTEILQKEERQEARLEEEEEEDQTLIRYLLVRYTDEDQDADTDTLMSLAVTNSDLVLLEENFQWPLPRLQAPLSDSLKSKQFNVVRREKINNIESLMFNEFNPKELRLSFFESSDVNSKSVWMISMATTAGVKSFVDAIRDPWEEEFGVSLDVTSTSFTDESVNHSRQ